MRQDLDVFLAPYVRDLDLPVWSDKDIPIGDRWNERIEEALATTKVAVLLVTANYLASAFISRKEVPQILSDQSKGGLRIIWVAVSASAYSKTKIHEFQCANEPARPLDTLSKAERNRVWTAIAEIIHQAFIGNPVPETMIETEETPEDGRVVLVYKRGAQPDQDLLTYLEKAIRDNGFPVFIDRHLSGGIRWAERISAHIEKASAVIPLISAESVKSDMLAFELQIASQASQRQKGRPKLIPIRVGYSDRLVPPFDILDPIQQLIWAKPDENERLLKEIVNSLRQPVKTTPPRYAPPPGGVLPAESPFYVERACDGELSAAIQNRECLIHIKGPRQVGKSTAISMGIREAREFGFRTVRLDFQKFNQNQLADLPTLYRSIVEWFIDELQLDSTILNGWDPQRAPNWNLERALRRGILPSIEPHLLWAMDEVDRLFPLSFAGEFFALVRGWYNDRQSDPTNSAWAKLTILISYASEAHQAITEINQSPFNVGIEFGLIDFTLIQVNKLNELYGAPLKGWPDLEEFHKMIEGHPYLTQRGLYDLKKGATTWPDLQTTAAREDGPFGDHLRRVLVSLARNKDLAEAMRRLLDRKPGLSESDLFRLRRAGILVGKSPETAKVRCPVYRDYLDHALPH